MSAVWRVDSVGRLSSAPSIRYPTRLSRFTSPFHGRWLKTPASYGVPWSRRRLAYLLCPKSPPFERRRFWQRIDSICLFPPSGCSARQFHIWNPPRRACFICGLRGLPPPPPRFHL